MKYLNTILIIIFIIILTNLTKQTNILKTKAHNNRILIHELNELSGEIMDILEKIKNKNNKAWFLRRK